jgi:membrane protease YdiL (CAAX protease family)
MNELSHAAVCITVLVGDIVLGQAIDEDGAQRLVLAVVDCGIGIQEEPLATTIIHSCPLKCEVVFRGVLLSKVVSKREPRAKPDGAEGFGTREKPKALTGGPAE